MTMKISLFDINHLNTMIRESKAEKNNVVNEQETIQNNIKCRYRRPTLAYFGYKYDNFDTKIMPLAQLLTELLQILLLNTYIIKNYTH